MTDFLVYVVMPVLGVLAIITDEARRRCSR